MNIAIVVDERKQYGIYITRVFLCLAGFIALILVTKLGVPFLQITCHEN